MRKSLYLDIDLSLETRYIKEFVVKKQDSVNLCITLKNENIPVILEGQVPRLYIRKQDGTVVVQGGTEELGDGSIVLTGNTAIIKLKNSAINSVGLCYGELELEDAEGTTITQSFLFEVVDRLADTDTPIKAVNDIYLLGEVEKFIIQAKKDMEEIKSNITIFKGDMNKAIEEFNKKVEDTVLRISTAENSAIESINNNTISSLEQIASTTQQSVEEVNKTKEESLTTLYDTKEAYKVELGEKTVEGLRNLSSMTQFYINNIETVQKDFEVKIGEADVLKTELEKLRLLAEQTKTGLNEKTVEGKQTLELLDAIITSAKATQLLLEEENRKALTNSNELKLLNPEADLNIEELKKLIAEARDIAIPALKAYIKEHKPAEDLTEVNAQLEELYNAVAELDIRFNNYYTKEEVDGKFEELKTIGEIGSEGPPACYLIAPDSPFGDNTKCIIRYQDPKTYMYYIAYISNSASASFPYAQKSGTACYLYFSNSQESTHMVVYGYTTEWKTLNVYRYITAPTILSSSLDIPYRASSAEYEGLIYFKAKELNFDIVNDYNVAIIDKYYTIKQLEMIDNAPHEEIEGYLINDFATNKIIQTVFDIKNKATYIREKNDDTGWTEWTVLGGDIDLSNYYNKTEVDEKISNIDLTLYAKKDEVETSLLNKVDKVEGKDLSKNDFTDELKEKLEKVETIKGIIGAGEKIATPPIGMYDNIPEPPEKAGAEYIGKAMYKSGDYYYLIYMYNTEKYNPYLYIDATISTIYTIKASYLATTYNTLVGYRRTSINEEWSSTSFGNFYPEYKTTGIYYLDMPIYSNIDKTGIYRHPTTDTTISNLDLITEPGDYLLNATISNYSNIQNIPPVKLKTDLETILKCYKKDYDVYQELVIEGITYTRKVGDIWIYNNHNDCVKKEIIAEIKNEEITAFSVLPDIYSTCPKPNISCDIVGEIAFKRNDDLYAMWYVTSNINNPMFFNYNDKNIGFTGSYQYLVKYNYQNGVWTEDTGTTIYTTITAGKYEIYKNTLPICLGKGTSTYDKNTILKEATTDEEEKILNSFNLAIDIGTYKVEITEAGGVEFSPIDTAFTGILEVEKADNYIKQVLTTIETGTKAYRTFNGTAWSNWNFEAKVEYGEHIMEATALLNETQEGEIFDIMPLGTFKDTDKYYVRISPKQKFTKVTGVTVHSDLADLIIGFELAINVVLINNSNDFFIFIKNNFKDPGGYEAYTGLTKLIGRPLKYSIIGY